MAEGEERGGVRGEGRYACVGGAGGGGCEYGVCGDVVGGTYRPSSSLRSPWRFSSRLGAARVVAVRAERRRVLERMVFCCGFVDVTPIVP